MAQEIVKGATNYSLNLFTRNTINNPADFSRGQFLLAADPITQMVSGGAGTPIVSQHAVGTSRTIAVDEVTNGHLNHVYVGWNRVTPTFEICDLGVYCGA